MHRFATDAPVPTMAMIFTYFNLEVICDGGGGSIDKHLFPISHSLGRSGRADGWANGEGGVEGKGGEERKGGVMSRTCFERKKRKKREKERQQEGKVGKRGKGNGKELRGVGEEGEETESERGTERGREEGEEGAPRGQRRTGNGGGKREGRLWEWE